MGWKGKLEDAFIVGGHVTALLINTDAHWLQGRGTAIREGGLHLEHKEQQSTQASIQAGRSKAQESRNKILYTGKRSYV